MVKKIKQGEYVDVDKLLLPSDDTVPGQAVVAKKNHTAKWQVYDVRAGWRPQHSNW